MDRNILRQLFPEEEARRDEGLCATCGKKIHGFSDTLSLKEWKISGMCQACQDITFVEPDEDIPFGIIGEDEEVPF